MKKGRVLDFTKENVNGSNTSNEIEDWHYVGDPGEPVLQNGVSVVNANNYGKPRFKKINNIVYVEGVVKNCQANKTIFQLPIKYRPGANTLIENVSQTDNKSYIIIKKNGKIISGTNTGNNNVSLHFSILTDSVRIEGVDF